MQFVALNWHIYELTHSPIALGLIGLVRVVPIVGFSLLAGLIADATDRRKLMMVTQTVMMLVAVGLAVLTDVNLITPVAIYALTAIGAGAVAFDSPARQSLIPNLVPRPHFANAVSLGTIAWQGANIVGPMLAGVVIARLGVGAVYWINAVSFLAVLAALMLMRTRTVIHGEKRDVSLGALKEGLSFVFHQPLVRGTMILDFIATFFAAANQLLPIYAKDILGIGAEGLGLLSAASAVGAVGTSFVLTFIPRLRRQGPLLLVAVGLYGVGTVIFGVSRVVWLSFAALALTGAADIVSTVIRQTIRQLVTPDRLRGRMVSVNMIFFMGGPQLGEFEAGVAAALIGPVGSVVLGGVLCMAAVMLMAATSPELRTYDEEPPHESAPASPPPAAEPAAGLSPGAPSTSSR